MQYMGKNHLLLNSSRRVPDFDLVFRILHLHLCVCVHAVTEQAEDSAELEIQQIV